MKLRRFGKTNEKVSPLGFGTMRLPVIDGKYGQIDEEKSVALIRQAIDNGINYIDTAWPYHEEHSEGLVAKALKDGYREKVFVATKLPSWLIQTREDMDKYLNIQLERLETEVIDFYLIHALNRKYWSNLMTADLLGFIDKAKADGRIKHIGFSFHDEVDLFKEIVDAYDWEFCLVQHNFMDVKYQAGIEGIRYAREKDMGIAIMEPLRGGSLIKDVPDDVQVIWDSGSSDRTPAQWALGYVFNMPEVSIVLSGMNELQQLEENIEEASRTLPGSFSDEEIGVVEKVRAIYQERIRVNCTTCRYCMPCPAGVNIPGCFTYYNNASMYDNKEKAKGQYHGFMTGKQSASHCVECGRCEAVCPQHIPIIKVLKDVVVEFE